MPVSQSILPDYLRGGEATIDPHLERFIRNAILHRLYRVDKILRRYDDAGPIFPSIPEVKTNGGVAANNLECCCWSVGQRKSKGTPIRRHTPWTVNPSEERAGLGRRAGVFSQMAKWETLSFFSWAMPWGYELKQFYCCIIYKCSTFVVCQSSLCHAHLRNAPDVRAPSSQWKKWQIGCLRKIKIERWWDLENKSNRNVSYFMLLERSKVVHLSLWNVELLLSSKRMLNSFIKKIVLTKTFKNILWLRILLQT